MLPPCAVSPTIRYKLNQALCRVLPEWHDMAMKRIVGQITVKRFISALFPFFLMRKVTGATVCIAIKKHERILCFFLDFHQFAFFSTRRPDVPLCCPDNSGILRMSPESVSGCIRNMHCSPSVKSEAIKVLDIYGLKQSVGTPSVHHSRRFYMISGGFPRQIMVIVGLRTKK